RRRTGGGVGCNRGGKRVGGEMITVRFEAVGRDKKSWETQLESLSDAALIRQIRQRAALMSRDMEFDWDDAGESATIVVGGFRCVGSVRVIDGGGFKLNIAPMAGVTV